MKDRDERSRGMEIRIADALAKIKPTEPLFRHFFFWSLFFLSLLLLDLQGNAPQAGGDALLAEKNDFQEIFEAETSTFRKSKNSFCKSNSETGTQGRPMNVWGVKPRKRLKPPCGKLVRNCF
jgi:hypothetical protein